MKSKVDVIARWHEPTRSWVAASTDPPSRASARSPRTAVRRVRAALGGGRKLRVAVDLPPKAAAAIERYRAAAEELARRQQHVLDMQLELAQQLIACGLNRSEAAVVVGMSHSHLSKLLDGKFARPAVEQLAPPDPTAELADFIADERIGAARYARNKKQR